MHASPHAHRARRWTILLDETSSPAGWIGLAPALERLREEGLEIRQVAIACPYQPYHPRPEGTGAWEPWDERPLPAEDALVATSLSTALLAAAIRGRPARWLMHRDPIEEFPPSHPARKWTRSVLRAGLARPVVTSEVLEAVLQERDGVEADFLPAGPGPLVDEFGSVHLGRRIVVDHSAAHAEGLAAVALALQGLGARTILLTDLLDPPWADAFDEVRIRVPDRRPWYARATAVVKVDEFHGHRHALGAIWLSGAPLLALGGEVDRLGGDPGRTVWEVADRRADRLRSDVQLALEHPKALGAMAERARREAEIWSRSARERQVRLGELRDLDERELREVLHTVLSDPQCQNWNRTILRGLMDFLDRGRRS